jgi:hypothetical protein
VALRILDEYPASDAKTRLGDHVLLQKHLDLGFALRWQDFGEVHQCVGVPYDPEFR